MFLLLMTLFGSRCLVARDYGFLLDSMEAKRITIRFKDGHWSIEKSGGETEAEHKKCL